MSNLSLPILELACREPSTVNAKDKIDSNWNGNRIELVVIAKMAEV